MRWLFHIAKRPGAWQASAALIAMFSLFITAAHAATDDFYVRGLPAAQAGNFAEAASVFENESKLHPASGVFVDLGIVEWQRGHAGAAILAWERATWIDPYDALANQNLKFARTVAQVDAPELRWFETASTWLPANAWVWIAGASLWLAVGALVLPRVLRRRRSGWQQSLAALGFCLFIFSITANVGVVTRTDIGFVVKKNAPLRLTPTSGSELISTLSAGEPVRRVKTRGDYYFIRSSMTSGWIERDQIGLINE